MLINPGNELQPMMHCSGTRGDFNGQTILKKLVKILCLKMLLEWCLKATKFGSFGSGKNCKYMKNRRSPGLRLYICIFDDQYCNDLHVDV